MVQILKNSNIKDFRVGETNLNTQGLLMTIVKYNSSSDINIEFENGEIVKNKTYRAFKQGYIRNELNNILKNDKKIGETKLNNKGLTMKIINFNSNNDVDVIFDSGYISKNKRYSDFLKGEIEDRYHKNIFGIGFLGNHSAETNTNAYNTWYHMMSRCYKNGGAINYKDCFVCDEWHDYSNFKRWYEENLWSDDFRELDKDLLVRENKIYSPHTCVLIDQRLNKLLTNCKKTRRKYPIGVSYNSKTNQIFSRCRINDNKVKYLGTFKTVEQAFIAYKDFKETYIKKVADEYKNKYENFPEKLYQAIYNYKININD